MPLLTKLLLMGAIVIVFVGGLTCYFLFRSEMDQIPKDVQGEMGVVDWLGMRSAGLGFMAVASSLMLFVAGLVYWKYRDYFSSASQGGLNDRGHR